MRKVSIIFFILITTQLLSQNVNKESKIFSLYNSDNIFLKATILNADTDRIVIVNIINNSLKKIYIDTSYIYPIIWRDSINGPVIGIKISHLSKEDVNEQSLTVFAINPLNEIKIKIHFAKKTFKASFDKVKYYSFEIKYLNEEDFNKVQEIKANYRISTLTYYLLSKRFVVGNCEVKNYLDE